MKRTVIGGALMAGVLLGALVVGQQQAEASKPWTPTVKIACAKCHTSKKQSEMNEKDLTDCGKEALELLKKHDYVKGKTEADQKKWGEKLKELGFKCKAS